ncbi:MAG: LacI family transcriptional regulator [Rhodospirillales bacterium 20-64-7]|nr:MAG: LacI family transcriptional regulator [Rhodospirillales bacterium 20-64-7]
MKQTEPDQGLGRYPVARDVAERAGVSTATVSRVLNGTPGVRADKREAVLRAVREMGFVANGAARALSLRRFGTVGAVIPNIENEEFIRAVSAFQKRLRDAGYTLLLTNAGYDLDVELREAVALLERGIDGLLLVGDIHRPDLLTRLQRQAVPLVQTFTLSKERDCVGFDNKAAAHRATSYLLDLGHRRIGIVTGFRKDNDRGGARVEGVRQALAARSLAIHPAHDITTSYGIGAGRDALRQILNAGVPSPTAMICGTDQFAFGVMIEAHDSGLRVPDDLSVIGFNDADYAAFLSPSLTTVRVHAAEIGRIAGEHLVARMAGEPRVRVTEIDAELIVRGSTAPPRPDQAGR